MLAEDIVLAGVRRHLVLDPFRSHFKRLLTARQCEDCGQTEISIQRRDMFLTRGSVQQYVALDSLPRSGAHIILVHGHVASLVYREDEITLSIQRRVGQCLHGA